MMKLILMNCWMWVEAETFTFLTLVFTFCVQHIVSCHILILTFVKFHRTSYQDPELEKLHAERIAALKVLICILHLWKLMQVSYSFYSSTLSMQQKEAEKREVLKRQGHGEYREITEGDFLGEVTGSEMVICHFYHREFYRCKYAKTSFFLLLPIYSFAFCAYGSYVCKYLLGSWISI